MPQQDAYLTHEGLEQLTRELEYFKAVRRQEVATRIQRSKEISGTVDNADYEEAKNEQAFVEGRILTLENMVARAVLIPDHAISNEEVAVGAKVTMMNPRGEQEQYTIVGSAEADPAKGRISTMSPIGRVLIGKRIGDEAEAMVPSGTIKFKVVAIE
jgi:transcription elongation factor GreA